MGANDTSRRLASVVGLVLKVHVVATILQNTPDTHNQDLRNFVGRLPIPGWRFFAPNPGVQNVHLLVRTRGVNESDVTDWEDVTPVVDHGFLRVLWNPGSRGPKALFDAMQQVSVLRANYAKFDYVTSSDPYKLVATAAHKAVAGQAGRETQFLLLNDFPSVDEDTRMQPVMVSEWFDSSGVLHGG